MQDYLSFGYLYLLALGIIHDVVYYNFLGVNILSHSDITDVLLSPLASLAEIPQLFLVMLFVAGIIFVADKLVAYLRKRQAQKKPQKNIETPLEAFIRTNFILIAFSIAIFAMYLGLGLGEGMGRAEQLRSGEYTPKHRLYFENADSTDVWILGQNSRYIFCAVPPEKRLSVVPLEGNLKLVKQLEPAIKKNKE